MKKTIRICVSQVPVGCSRPEEVGKRPGQCRVGRNLPVIRDLLLDETLLDLGRGISRPLPGQYCSALHPVLIGRLRPGNFLHKRATRNYKDILQVWTSALLRTA